jgi:hypothetical protein
MGIPPVFLGPLVGQAEVPGRSFAFVLRVDGLHPLTSAVAVVNHLVLHLVPVRVLFCSADLVDFGDGGLKFSGLVFRLVVLQTTSKDSQRVPRQLRR